VRRAADGPLSFPAAGPTARRAGAAPAAATVAGRSAAAGPSTPSAASTSPYDAVPLAFTGLFSVYVLAWFLEVGKRIEILGAIRFEFLLGAVLTAIAVPSLLGRASVDRNPLPKYAIAYLAFLTLHLPLSQSFAVSWETYIDRVLKFSCMTLFLWAFVRNPRTLRLFIAAFLLACLKLGQEAFVGKVTGSMVWENQGVMRLNGAPGTLFGHPNSLAGLAVGTLPFIYYLWPCVSRRARVALLVLLVFAVNIIVFTGSRTGYVGTLLLVAFLFLRSPRKLRFLGALLLVGILAAPLVPDQYVERFMTTFVGKEREGSSKEHRLEIAGDAWRIFLANPLGVGIYGFAEARLRQLGKYPMDTHNLYLQVLADLGVGGAVFFGAFLVALWRQLQRVERDLAAEVATVERLVPRGRSPSPASDELAAHLQDLRFMRAVATAFLAYLAARLFLGLFGHDLYEIYWWLSAGATIALTNMLGAARRRTAELAREAAIEA
jgi:putative inorganic carbon (HCO3(-)) transporter